MMSVAIGEPNDLVLDRGAVARTAFRLDLSGVHRGQVEIGADQIVHRRRGSGLEAGDLPDVRETPVGKRALGQKREPTRPVVPNLLRQRGEIDGLPPEARRRAGLEAAEFESKPPQILGDPAGAAFADTAAHRTLGAGVHEGPHERAGCQDQCRDLESGRHRRPWLVREDRAGRRVAGAVRFDRRTIDPDGPAALAEPRRDDVTLVAFAPNLDRFERAGPDLDRRLLGEQPLDLAGVVVLVALGPWSPHRRTATGVENAEHDAGGIGGPAHESAKRVDLADHLSLREAADRGIAAHRPDARGSHREQDHPSRVAEHIGRGPGRLDPRMATADDEDHRDRNVPVPRFVAIHP